MAYTFSADSDQLEGAARRVLGISSDLGDSVRGDPMPSLGRYGGASLREVAGVFADTWGGAYGLASLADDTFTLYDAMVGAAQDCATAEADAVDAFDRAQADLPGCAGPTYRQG